ncbi:SIMPL domain-containing protein [Helcococcus kunzii]|uniref:SIMPL domain-containing protein n=1 Tax=Helcococcus kunzii TaxID=40091 RepID=UPI0024ACF899|nr:SIMPL domain-containing protein [Helcococcus kunzii]
MEKTITVRGTGSLSIKPNYIEISINLETKHMNYEEAYNNSLEKIDKLNSAISNAGFSADKLKSTNFNIESRYKSIRDENDEYQQIFDGYEVYHSLKLGFDFNLNDLSRILSEITKSANNPNISIRFTVKDHSEIKEKLLEDAVKNARQIAEVLCENSNVTLGELITIDYSWQDINLYSSTEYRPKIMQESSMGNSIDINPDDIEISDSATFVWRIK